MLLNRGRFNFLVDEDTTVVLQLIMKYLKKYFNYDSDGAVNVINDFYSKMRPIFSKETETDFLDLNFHHDHPFLVACRIHYSVVFRCVGNKKVPLQIIEDQ